MRSIALLFLALYIAAGCATAVESEPISKAIDIHRLSRPEATEGRPVKITGVVTFPGVSPAGWFVIDDGTRGVFVNDGQAKTSQGTLVSSPAPPQLRAGMQVEVTGVTHPGRFAPQIEAREVRVLGSSPLPAARSVTLNELLSGRYDCQRVALRGVVQDAGIRRDLTRFSLATLEGRCEVNSLSDLAPLTPLIDAEVIVRGVCFTFFNPRAELAGVWLRIASADDIEVLTPAPPDPYAVPELDPRNLRPFSLSEPPLHRRLTRGTVTLCRPGEFIYIQDGDRGVRIQTQQDAALLPGTQVLVSGFVEMRHQYAELREALIRPTGHAALPAPQPLTQAALRQTFEGYFPRGAADLDGRLVSLPGRLLQIESTDTGHRIYVETEGAVRSAELGGHTAGDALAALRLGSEVKLTGVCVTELSSAWPAQDVPRITGYRLLLRDIADIAVIQPASWWTAQRLWKVLAVVFATLLLALCWALFLRRRVERERQAKLEQEREREAAEVEFEATTRERERLAADLHDTLEQALTGVAFQLEALHRLREQPPERSDRHLGLARQMLARSREEVRRSVWNLRANALEGRMLREALLFIAEGLTEGQDIVITSGGTGEEEALPDLIAGNLLMLAKEGITNALKHAAPRALQLTVDYAPDRVTLTVTDDGVGFVPEAAAGPHQGHFGLQGMRERARRLGAEFEITSAPGHGTKVQIKVPISAPRERKNSC